MSQRKGEDRLGDGSHADTPKISNSAYRGFLFGAFVAITVMNWNGRWVGGSQVTSAVCRACSLAMTSLSGNSLPLQHAKPSRAARTLGGGRSLLALRMRQHAIRRSNLFLPRASLCVAGHRRLFCRVPKRTVTWPFGREFRKGPEQESSATRRLYKKSYLNSLLCSGVFAAGLVLSDSSGCL